MLTQLAINNLAIVHSQTLELSPGLTVLTGETGQANPCFWTV